jgi:hypothetical protein
MLSSVATRHTDRNLAFAAWSDLHHFDFCTKNMCMFSLFRKENILKYPSRCVDQYELLFLITLFQHKLKFTSKKKAQAEVPCGSFFFWNIHVVAFLLYNQHKVYIVHEHTNPKSRYPKRLAKRCRIADMCSTLVMTTTMMWRRKPLSSSHLINELNPYQTKN